MNKKANYIKKFLVFLVASLFIFCMMYILPVFIAKILVFVLVITVIISAYYLIQYSWISENEYYPVFWKQIKKIFNKNK